MIFSPRDGFFVKDHLHICIVGLGGLGCEVEIALSV